MIVTAKPCPVDPVFRHPVTTPAARLATLTAAAREAIGSTEDGTTLDGLARALDATHAEARDTAQAIGSAAVWYCSSRGWRIRIRSPQERRLVAANDNTPMGYRA
ncbi:hypothetical protein [Aurantimonas sp. A3-2-R12]|uniref:hypothetical protein n=1 Tax=Aurantimonas sp. A3-2-R12 TaxID=3114362 RepID=UPI002E17FDE9|nr:hypothetical protein [Aurantimonas sp. A3-2-R12]